MKKAVIIHHTRTGTTKRYAEAIGKYLESKDIEVKATSTTAFQSEMMENVDYVFLGCWTKGLYVIGQHPEKLWRNFSASLPVMPDAKLALFTTYKILTGSMFRKMFAHLKNKFARRSLDLKSRDGSLSEADKIALDKFIS